jgi:hypothetical protein
LSKTLASHVSIGFHSRDHPYSKSLSQTMIVGAQRGAHEIDLCEIDGVQIYKQVPSWLEAALRIPTLHR